MSIKTKVIQPLSRALTAGMLCAGICGCGGSNDQDGNASQQDGKATKSNSILAVKGLSIGMSGDAAAEACKKIVGDAKDIAVIDLRNGYTRAKDEATLAKEKAAYDENVALAKEDVNAFFNWYNSDGLGFDQMENDYADRKVRYQAVKVFADSKADALVKGRGCSRAVAIFAFAANFNYPIEWMVPVEKNAGPNERPKEYVGMCDKEMITASKDYFFSCVAGKELLANGLQAYKPGGRSRVWFRVALRDANGEEVSKAELFRKYLDRNPLRKPRKGASQAEIASYKKNMENTKNEFELYLNWIEFNGNSYLLATSNGAPDFNAKGKTVRVSQSEMQSFAANNNLLVEWMVPTLSGGIGRETGTIAVEEKEQDKAGRSMYDTMTSLGEGKHIYDEIKKKGLKMPRMDNREAWFRLADKDANGGEISRERVEQDWLTARGVTPPSDMFTLPKKNVISIRLRNNKRTEDEWKPLCSVWIDNSGNVKEVYFTEAGLNRLFNAKNISTTELADLLVKNYKGIPSLNKTVMTESETRDGSVAMKTFTWIYKGKDYQVKLLECDFFDQNDRKFDIRPDLGMAMATQANKFCEKYLAITAVDQSSAPKFD